MGLIVIAPGLSTTVQDAGRLGFRGWGVGPGGAFDRASAELANALVGNPAGYAVLELTLTGGCFEADSSMALAMAGAPMDAKVIGPDGTDQSLRIPSSCSIRSGQRLILGRAREGARTYLAVQGGWQTRNRLGSRSSEMRLRVGDVLPAAPGSIATRYLAQTIWEPPAAKPFRIIEGPDGRSNPALDEAFWSSRRFVVGTRSDRMGLRLEGEAVNVTPEPDRLSIPVTPGAIQGAGGQLIVLGVACGTMGGYPHIAQVISADLDRLGQLRPGDPVAFRRVSLEMARLADRESRQARESFLKPIASMVHQS